MCQPWQHPFDYPTSGEVGHPADFQLPKGWTMN